MWHHLVQYLPMGSGHHHARLEQRVPIRLQSEVDLRPISRKLGRHAKKHAQQGDQVERRFPEIPDR